VKREGSRFCRVRGESLCPGSFLKHGGTWDVGIRGKGTGQKEENAAKGKEDRGRRGRTREVSKIFLLGCGSKKKRLHNRLKP